MDDLDGCTYLEEEELDEMLRVRGVTNEMLGFDHVIEKRTLDVSVAQGRDKHWPNGIVTFKFDGSHCKHRHSLALFD